MLPMNTLAGVIQPGPLVNQTIDWIMRCAEVDGWGFLIPLNNLIRNGQLHGWLTDDSELFCLGASTQQACLEGIMGNINASDVTVNGDISFIPRYGALRTDLSQNSFIDLGVSPHDFPGIEVDSHSLAIFLATNYLGSYQEAGSNGTAGASDFMIRGSSGYRSGAWSSSNQTIFGTGAAWGVSAFSRTGSSTLSMWKHQIRQAAATPSAGPLSDNNITLLSAEPSVSNSPNQLLLAHFGPGLTDQQGDYRAADFIQFVRELGIYGEIAVPDIVLGPNCFGPSALAGVLPSDRRVYRQLIFPATNATPASATNAYPITDSILRAYQITNTDYALGADPISTVDGTSTLTIADTGPDGTGHSHAVDDVVGIFGATATRGILASILNKRHRITAVPNSTSYQIVVSGTATSTGSGGGSIIHPIYWHIRFPNTAFVPPRGGRLWHNIWNNRGERDTADGPITSTQLKGNDSYGPIPRLTTQVSPAIKAGTLGRPCFTTKPLAIAAMLVHSAHNGGLAARDDSRLTTAALNAALASVGLPADVPARPAGWGYLDIAEYWGLDAAKVIQWQDALIGADDIFTVPGVDGSATCYDYTILASKRVCDIPSFGPSTTGLWRDDEPSDGRFPELRLKGDTWLDVICGAAGIKWGNYGHYLAGSVAATDGWTRDNASKILALPNVESISITAAASALGVPGGTVPWLQEQADMFSGPVDAPVAILYGKIIVSCTTGAGKNSILDDTPFSTIQPTFDECDAVAVWMNRTGKVIKHVHLRRFGMVEGGEIERVPNQQMIRYWPNLGATPEQSGIALTDAWTQQVVFNGGVVSDARYGTMVTFISALLDAGVWAKVDSILLLFGENDAQALTDIKHYTLATVHGAPVIGASYTEFDGVDDYIDHGWAPSSGSVITGSSCMLAVDVLGEVEHTSQYACGCVNAGSQGLRLNPTLRSGPTFLIQGQACWDNTAASTASGQSSPISGLFGVQKAPTNVGSYWYEGASLATPTVSSPTTSLPTRSMVTGGLNSNGTVNSFKAGKRRLTTVGQSLSSGEWVAFTAAVRALIAAVESGVG